MLRTIDGGKGEVCRRILAALPAWFGIPEAIEEYAAAAETETMIGVDIDGDIAGFALLKATAPETSELLVIAVREEYHRRGVGRQLVEGAGALATSLGHRFITVKTIGPSHPSVAYARTRRFYEALDFIALEEFPNLWDGNPCLFMVKTLR